MDSIDTANEEYQARMERGDRIRARMWNDHDRVVSALTTREVTHEQARQIAQLRAAVKFGHPAMIHHAAKVLCEMFDDQIFEYVSGLTE